MGKYQRNIINSANRNLTNRADGDTLKVDFVQGDPCVSDGLGKFFGATVQNLESNPVAMALFAANFDTERFVIDDGAVIRTFDDFTALNTAGYPVGAVLADGETDATINGKKVHVISSANDPMRTIKQLVDYVKLNPQKLTKLEIISSTQNMWSTNLMVTFCNPFFKNKETTVQLTTFFSRFQYQPDRVSIDFCGENKLEISDLTLLVATIPAEATVQFLLTFE